MSDEGEWGPWIDHDGKGCPCRGDWVQAQDRSGDIMEARATGEYGEAGSAWDWASIPHIWWDAAIIRYRIRKPRGLTILESLLENLPEEVDA